MLVKAKDLRKMWDEKGPQWTSHHVLEALKNKEVALEDFSIRDMAQQLIPDGREFVDELARGHRGGMVTEAIHAVDTSAFSHIQGQLMFSAIQDGMDIEELIGDQLVANFPSQFQNEELVPGIGGVEDEFDTNVVQGEPYPLIGLAEEYITIPAAEKKGGILGITREALIGDRTGKLIDRARSIGTGLAIRREKSILDVVIGAVNPYSYKGEARLTYGDGATAGQAMGFINEATPELINYTDIQEVAEVFYAFRDPITNEPMAHSPDTLLCCPFLSWTAEAVFNDVQVRLGDVTAAPGIQSIGSNRIPSKFKVKVLTNEWVTQRVLLANGGAGGITAANRAAANLHWFFGKPTKAFVWKEIAPLTVEEAPSNNEAQFTQDILMRFKANYIGVAGVREPRFMIRSDGTA